MITDTHYKFISMTMRVPKRISVANFPVKSLFSCFYIMTGQKSRLAIMHYSIPYYVLKGEQGSNIVKMSKSLKNSFLLLTILLLLSSAAGSCSIRRQTGSNSNNRVMSRPHKNWKQPRSRYPGKRKYRLSFQKTYVLAIMPLPEQVFS
jgi:hypothetical protein